MDTAVVTLFWSAPWSALSSRTVGALVEAGATASATASRSLRARSFSLYDLMCNLDDAHAMQAQRERIADPVTLDSLDDELEDLHIEHLLIRRAFTGSLDAPHHHFA